MTTTETLAAETWLYSVLSGDATLSAMIGGQVYSYVAPERATYPFVMFHQQAASDVSTVATIRIASSLLYVVKAIGCGRSFALVDPIAQRLDVLLHAQSGMKVLNCVRQSPFSYQEFSGNLEFRHLGGIYRLMVQP